MPSDNRIMALDVGEVKIGVALSDPEGIIATPLTVIPAKDRDVALDNVVKLVNQNEVKQIVVGMPRSLSGDMGMQAQFTEVFIRQLSQRCSIPIETWDERFSSTSANYSMRQGKLKRKEQKDWRDAIAAALILQAYLERQRYKKLENKG